MRNEERRDAEAWLAEGEKLGAIASALFWRIGDWAFDGLWNHGRAVYVQGIKRTALPRPAVEQYRKVAGSVSPTHRAGRPWYAFAEAALVEKRPGPIEARDLPAGPSLRCESCGQRMWRSLAGRSKRYCSDGCRQAAYRRRRTSRAA